MSDTNLVLKELYDNLILVNIIHVGFMRLHIYLTGT